MSIDVANAINELLYENKSITIPGFGGFTTDYKSATVDYVQGAVAPPSKKIAFNPNLKIDDGILVAFLQKKYAISVEEAKTAIEKYVEQMDTILGNKEIVEIPRVGRLYLDYEKNMKFLPEGTNFSPDSFGLPTVNFYPVMRDKSSVPKAATAATTAGSTIQQGTRATATAVPPLPKSKTKSSSLPENWWLWAILGVAAILLMVSTCHLLSDGSDIDNERINTSPMASEESQEEDLGMDDPEDLADFEEDGQPLDEQEATALVEEEEPFLEEKEADDFADIDSEGSSLAASERVAFVQLNYFGSKSNAENFFQQLSQDGYNAAKEQEGKFYRIGVNFIYKSEWELDQFVDEVNQKYKTKAKIFKGGIGRRN